MACMRGWQANLSGGEEPERIRATMASSQFFTLFGVNPTLGRAFGTEDAKPGNARVVVLSHGLWTRRYGADRNVIGRDLILDGEKFSVIGVMPATFSPTDMANSGSHRRLMSPHTRFRLTTIRARCGIGVISKRGDV